MNDENIPPEEANAGINLSSNSGASTVSSPQQSSGSITGWKPDGTLFASLISMGIDPLVAKKALFYTHNSSAEVAIEWIFTSDSATDGQELPLEEELAGDMDEARGASFDDYKMIFIVNAELSMGAGKVAAQVAHAALGIHRILLQHQMKYGESLLNWSENGETKIVLKGSNTQQLIDLEREAMALELPCYLVHDAGFTQVQAGSTTVLAIFGSRAQVDQVSGRLSLY